MKQDLYQEIVAYIIENQNKFYRLAYSYVGKREDALDLVQNAVCRALEHYGGLKNAAAVRAWFYRILVNECLQFLKEKKRVLPAPDDQLDAVYVEKDFEGDGNLYDYINQLDLDTQTIIKLRFFEDLPLKEIAQIMELNLSTVKAKLYRGLERLKVTLQEVDL